MECSSSKHVPTIQARCAFSLLGLVLSVSRNAPEGIRSASVGVSVGQDCRTYQRRRIPNSLRLREYSDFSSEEAEKTIVCCLVFSAVCSRLGSVMMPQGKAACGSRIHEARPTTVSGRLNGSNTLRGRRLPGASHQQQLCVGFSSSVAYAHGPGGENCWMSTMRLDLHLLSGPARIGSPPRHASCW